MNEKDDEKIVSAGADGDMRKLYNQLIYLQDVVRKRSLTPKERSKELGLMSIIAFGAYRCSLDDYPEVKKKLMNALERFFTDNPARITPDVEVIKPIMEQLPSSGQKEAQKADFAVLVGNLAGGAISIDKKIAKNPAMAESRMIWLKNNKQLNQWRMLKGL